MEITLTLWQLTGIVIAGVLGIVTVISVLVAAGVRFGKFVTRDDLDKTGDKLEKKIDDEVAGLQKKIDDEVAGLQKKIDDNNERMDRRFDEVMLAIQNLGARLETAIMEHTHDEDGVAVFRRHPQMVDADD